MRIEIATNVAKVMSDIGTNAKFVNIGGNAGISDGKTGNVFLDTMAGIPSLMMMSDIKSDAMNNSTFTNDLKSVVNAILDRTNEAAATNEKINPEKPNIVTKKPINEKNISDETDVTKKPANEKTNTKHDSSNIKFI